MRLSSWATDMVCSCSWAPGGLGRSCRRLGDGAPLRNGGSRMGWAAGQPGCWGMHTGRLPGPAGPAGQNTAAAWRDRQIALRDAGVAGGRGHMGRQDDRADDERAHEDKGTACDLSVSVVGGRVVRDSAGRQEAAVTTSAPPPACAARTAWHARHARTAHGEGSPHMYGRTGGWGGCMRAWCLLSAVGRGRAVPHRGSAGPPNHMPA